MNKVFKLTKSQFSHVATALSVPFSIYFKILELRLSHVYQAQHGRADLSQMERISLFLVFNHLSVVAQLVNGLLRGGSLDWHRGWMGNSHCGLPSGNC